MPHPAQRQSPATVLRPHGWRRACAALLSQRLNPLYVALAVQGLLLIAAAWILVFRAPPPPAAVFADVGLPQAQPQALQRQSLLAQMARSTPGEQMPQALAADASSYSIPSLQDTALPASGLQRVFSPFGSQATADSGTAFGTGAVATQEALAAIGEAFGAHSPAHYFGIEENARRYLIVLDTSNSMFERSRGGTRHRYDYGRIKEETAALIDSFNANTLFNLIVYEGGARAWKEHMQAATAANREEARAWVRAIGENPSLSIRDRRGDGPLLIEGGGTRLDTALRLALRHYDPQAVFVVTDGEINSIPGGRIREETLVALIAELHREQTQPARIHVVHYQTAQMKEAELQTMRAIAREGRGRFIQVQASER